MNQQPPAHGPFRVLVLQEQAGEPRDLVASLERQNVDLRLAVATPQGDFVVERPEEFDVVVVSPGLEDEQVAAVLERLGMGSAAVLIARGGPVSSVIRKLLRREGTDLIRLPASDEELHARIRTYAEHRRQRILRETRSETPSGPQQGQHPIELRRANAALAAEVEHRKRIEAALRRSEERYELATSAAHTGVWDWNLETDEMFIDPKLKAMLGFEDAEIDNHIDAWSRHVHPEDADAVAEALQAHLSGKHERFEVVHRMCHGDGGARWFLARGSAVWNAEGEPIRLVGTDTDITERRHMEATIVSQNGLLNSVIESLTHPLYVIDVNDHTILLANSAAEQTGSVVGKKCFAASHGTSAPCQGANHPCPLEVVRATRGPVTVEHVHTTSDGKPRYYEIRGYPIFDADLNVKQMIEYALDITSRRSAEVEIRRRNRELTLLNSVITASTSESGADAVIAVACRGLREAFELHWVAAALFDVGEGRARIAAEDAGEREAVRTGRIVELSEAGPAGQLDEGPMIVQDLEQDGPPHGWGSGLLAPETRAAALVPLTVEGKQVGVLCLEHGRPRRFDDSEIELARRVAEQVAASMTRARLAQIRRRLQIAIEQSADSVVITDKDGVITYVNPAFERVTGYARAEAVGNKPSILKSGRQDDAFYARLWETIVAGRTWRGTFRNRSKSGSLFTEEAVITPVRDETGMIVSFIGLKRDVTKEQELEEHIRQSQKMESIGRLAGGVAHDFNNLLAVILGYAGLALGNLTPDSQAYDSIREIEETTQRAAAVTRQLLTFARRQVTEPRSLDLRMVLGNLDRIIERIVGENIEIKTVTSEDLWYVKVDSSQIEQVIINLVINARDAMSEGGRLVICLANMQVMTEAPVIEGAEPGDYVELAVHDTGAGMTDEVKSHLFEPFFTTKHREQGTGLGLATCFGIVKQSDGYIWVESTEGEGTTVRVLLPRSEPAGKPASTPPLEGGLPRGTETVFVAEDEDNLRRLACMMLHRLGYQVLEAENGDVALQVAESRIDDIDLLVTDVAMPRVSGPELARRLRAKRPDLPVLFTSGYASDSSDSRFSMSDTELLTKPFSPVVLAQAIRRMLDTRARNR